MRKLETSAAELTAVEAFERAEKGQIVTCPICASPLRTIPEKLPPGTKPTGLVCPTDQKHFLLYADDGDRLKEARARMQKLRKE